MTRADIHPRIAVLIINRPARRSAFNRFTGDICRDFDEFTINSAANPSFSGGIAFKSESQITRIFKKQFGLTLYEYLMDKRINAAKLYLLTSEMSIQEIAQRLQYTDDQHFASTFKSTLGKPQHNIVVRFGKR